MQDAGDPGPLGLIAGGGEMPRLVADAALASGRSCLILLLEDQAEPERWTDLPHHVVRLGAAGEMLRRLRGVGCREIIMSGRVKRPSLLAMRPDAEGAKFLARIGKAAWAGDDGLLSALVKALEAEGFVVRAPESVLTGSVAPAGVLGRVAPPAGALVDIARGVAVARALGSADVGQSVVVQQGLVLAVEAIEGTDAMLARAGLLRREGPGGVLVKLAKPGQERRADLPVIGVTTVAEAAKAGLSGIAIEAGSTLVPLLGATIAAADDAGLFLCGIDAVEEHGEAAASPQHA